jgi:non-homologous end joining protein Ku
LSCPVALYPATKKGPRSRVLFNRKTGNLVIRKRVDAATEKSIKTKYIFKHAKTGRALSEDDLAEIAVTMNPRQLEYLSQSPF